VPKGVEPTYITGDRRGGRMYCGDSLELLQAYPITRRRGRVNLIFTSPPFPLNRKKRYGNLHGTEYVEWLASFAPLLRDYLAEDGSVVIELGNGWDKGRPTMSTLPLEALLAFKERGDFYLCQEFIAYNPARLPSPAQWVNVERCRVKDAMTRLWWLSAVPRPKADNRRVLAGYSDSMRKLLSRGTYNAGPRPSQHRIGERSFLADHGGAIPSNLLIPAIEELLPDFVDAIPQLHGLLSISNTKSTDDYIQHCRDEDIEPHPARMPRKLADFFIEYLTDPGDLVLDPFAGSNTTGFAAESLGRRWLSFERDETYASASAIRFGLEPAYGGAAPSRSSGGSRG
jgi:DNA modification methylase